MSEHEKLVLEDLPKSAVVNSKVYAEVEDVEVNDLINNAVFEALNSNLSPELNKDKLDHQPAIPPDSGQDKLLEGDSGQEQEALEYAKNSHAGTSLIDVEAIKKEEYERGVADTVAKYQPLLDNASAEVKFAAMLQEKLNLIVPTKALDNEISKVSAEAISSIAKKLHLILPANFKEIITTGLVNKLTKFYKEGEITLTINPAKYDFCKELLQSDEIPDRFKDNFHLVRDSKVGLDDCTLEWQDTRLEYNQEQLSEEIDKIIEQLKTAS